MKKILLLGAGELGKELTIALKRYGQTVIAVDKYDDAPAMQVADGAEVINMLDGDALRQIVRHHQPDMIVPEIEAIRTEALYEFEKAGIRVIPSAKATNYTMNRKKIRDLAAVELGLQTAPYKYATSEEDIRFAVKTVGLPAVIKPLMSSSGKGQRIIRTEEEISEAWTAAQEEGRGDEMEVIVEGFIDFDFEITLLTVTQQNGPTLFCPPIGHRQERGDYQESWQPQFMEDNSLKEAQNMAKKITTALGGSGLWGIEFFVSSNKVYFSELSPRPHDTGMVTLAGTQNFTEFELHARAILGWPIPDIQLVRHGANAVILSHLDGHDIPSYEGMMEALSLPNSDLRIFGKPIRRKYRRMGIALTHDDLQSDTSDLVQRARKIASHIQVQ